MPVFTAQNKYNVYIFYIIIFSKDLVYNYFFQLIHTNSEKLWHYHLYTVIKDYSQRIPSPVNLILRPIQLIRYLIIQRKSTFIILTMCSALNLYFV